MRRSILVALLAAACLAVIWSFTTSAQVIDASPGAAHSARRRALRRMIDLYEAWGKPDEAGRYRALVATPTPRR